MGTRRNMARGVWLAVFCGLVAVPLRAATCEGPPALETKREAGASAVPLGNWFLQHGQSACAVEVFRAAVHADPHSALAIDGLARSYTAQANYPAAIDLLRHAPPMEPFIVDLATVYEKSGNTDQAAQTLVRAIRANPASARLTNALVLLMASHGHLDEAYQLAEKFARLHPHDPNAQKLYLRVLVATNDMASSRPLAKRLLLAAPADGELLYLNGVLERKAGEFEVARGHLQHSIAINPDFADSHFNLGLVLQQLGEVRGASEQLQLALALGNNDPELHLALSKAERSLGEEAPAQEQLTQYQAAMKTKSDDEMASSKAADADQALSKGEKEKAITLYREALEVKPHDGKLAYQLAMALDASGDTAGERVALEQTLQDEPGNALAQHQLGYVLFKSGDNRGAEEHFRMALRADPNFTQAWISLAATLASKSQLGEARDAVNHALQLDPHNAEAEQMKRMLPAAPVTR